MNTQELSSHDTLVKKKSLKDELWPKNSGEHYIYQTGQLGLSWIWVEYSKFYKYCQCRNNTSKCIKKKKEGTKKYKYTDFIFIFNTKYKIMPLETDKLIKV